MFGWKCVATGSLVGGIGTMLWGWLQWWMCNDIECFFGLIVGFILCGIGGKLWDEIKENG